MMNGVTERIQDAPEVRRAARFEWREYVAMVLAAFSVLWAPIALFLSGFALFYLLAWLWLRAL